MSRRVHYGDVIPDFGGSPVPACRKSGYVIGPDERRVRPMDRTHPPNPLYFNTTADSAAVTCKHCIKVLASRTHHQLVGYYATAVELTYDWKRIENLKDLTFNWR